MMARTQAHTTLVAEAAEWRLMGLLLERPRAGWHEEVIRLGAEVRDRALRDAAAPARDAAEGKYLRLLGPGGRVSPREVSYQPFADPGQLLAELAISYEAFAFRPQVGEPIDHIAVEVAFVSYLLLKEAFAMASGDRIAATTSARARRAFIESHLATFAATFVQRLELAAPSYLLSVAQLLAGRLPIRQAMQQPQPGGAADVCGACGAGTF
jgi:nitrate reductase assembly molybdenum cofactor insertion protein NarJ